MNEARKVALAVVGLGPWGSNLLRAFSSIERARIVAICDVDRTRVDAPVLLGGAVVRSTDAAEVMRRPDVDAVVLATPPPEHAPQAMAALGHGKHVFVEKPMALCARDAGMIEHAAAASRKKVMVGHILRHHPGLLSVIDLVANGALGEIRSVHATRLSATALAEHETAWWSLAPHDVSAIRAIVGQNPLAIRAFEDPPIGTGH
ncbi:MAG TPA: Gfo/Idh/MocA family oxidoreductase, partial [Polyangiaceae bacterium]|nr:Gfo/Idh/MocA family oxidoreductase [Polyangiaceae bacterium]